MDESLSLPTPSLDLPPVLGDVGGVTEWVPSPGHYHFPARGAAGVGGRETRRRVLGLGPALPAASGM